MRIEPRTFRNAFPSLSPQQQNALAQFYDFRKAETRARRRPRGAGLGVRAARTACATATSSGPTRRPGCCSRRASSTSSGEVVEQFAFTDITIGAQDRPRRWSSRRGRRRRRTGRCAQIGPGDVVIEGHRLGRHAAAARLRQDHGRLPHAARQARARSRTSSTPTAWSPSACSSSRSPRRRTRSASPQQGGINVYSRQARRLSRDGAGRGARRDRAPDRQFGRAPLSARRAESLSLRRAKRQTHHDASQSLRPSRRRRRFAALAAMLVAVARRRRRRAARPGCPISPSSTRSRARRSSSIDVTQTVRARRAMPELSEDDPFYEFFRRFGQIPRRAARPSASSSSSRSARASSSRSDGYIVTNAHVVDGADEVTRQAHRQARVQGQGHRRRQAHRRRAAARSKPRTCRR